jgi:hypothetical protein
MAASKIFLVGAGLPSLDDVLKVAHGLEVALDGAAAERVKKESPPPKSFEAEVPRYAPAEVPLHTRNCLDTAQARAAILVKLVSLIGGKSKARLAVLQALTDLLNKGITPCLPLGDVDQPLLAALADALQGGGAAALAGSGALLPLAQALQEAGLEAPGLSAAERAAVEDGQCASGGTAAICVQAGRALLAAAGAVAALSAEALQADVSRGGASLMLL